MQRNYTINSKINNWTVASEAIVKNGKEQYVMRCNICQTEHVFYKRYINRSLFSQQCASCSQKKRRNISGTYKVMDVVGNYTILEKVLVDKITKYRVLCTCGKEHTVSHSVFTKKNRKQFCPSCFDYGQKHSKQAKMMSNHISKAIYNSLKRQAILRGIEFRVSAEYLEYLYVNQNMKCALSNIDIFINKTLSTKGDRVLNTASLDRISSKIGYVDGNVQWVYKPINSMKNSLEQGEFIGLCNKISLTHANQQPR